MPLREAYELSYNDERQTRLREQISLCDTREMELVKQLGKGGIDKRLKDMDKAFAGLETMMGVAESKEDLASVSLKLKQLRKVYDGIKHNEAAWEKIHKNMEQRRALVETENKQKERLQGVVTPEMLLHFTSQLVRILKDNIEDRVMLNRISKGLRQLGGPSLIATPETVTIDATSKPAEEPIVVTSEPAELIRAKVEEIEVKVPKGSVFTGGEFELDFGVNPT